MANVDRHVDAEEMSSNKVENRGYSKSSPIGCVSQGSDPKKSILQKSWRIQIERSGGTHRKIFRMHLVPWKKFGNEKGHFEELSKNVSLMREILARPNLRKEHLRKIQDKKIVPAKQHGTWRKICKLKAEDNYVLFSCGNKGADINIKKKTREERMFVIDSGASMHMLSKKDLSSEELVHLSKVQNLYRGGNGKWRSANKRGCTSVCSRSWPLRDCAITRWNARSLIAWKTLRRPRIFPWVGQRLEPRLTKKGKASTCRVDNHVLLVVPVLSANPGSSTSSTSWKRDQFSTNLSEEERDVEASGNGTSKQFPNNLQPNKKIRNAGVMRMIDCKNFMSGWSLSQTIWTIQKPLCTRTSFSRLRFGTCYESGRKIKEAQYFYSILKMPRLWRLLESQIEDNGKKEVSSRIWEWRILKPEMQILKQAPWSRVKG